MPRKKGYKTKNQDGDCRQYTGTKDRGSSHDITDIPTDAYSNRFELFAELEDNYQLEQENTPIDPELNHAPGVNGMFEQIITSISELNQKFDSFSRKLITLEEKFNVIDDKVSKLSGKYNTLEERIRNENLLCSKICDTVQTLETDIERLKRNLRNDDEFPIATSLVFSGVKEASESSSLNSLMGGVITFGTRTPDIQIKNVKRMKSYNNKPGKVMVEVNTVDGKIAILRNKRNLMTNDNSYFHSIYVKSAQTKEERLLEQNTRSLLRFIPGLSDLRMSAGGMVVEKHNGRVHDNHNTMMNTNNHQINRHVQQSSSINQYYPQQLSHNQNLDNDSQQQLNQMLNNNQTNQQFNSPKNIDSCSHNQHYSNTTTRNTDILTSQSTSAKPPNKSQRIIDNTRPSSSINMDYSEFNRRREKADNMQNEPQPSTSYNQPHRR